MTAQKSSNVAYIFQNDDWDEITATELIPAVDSERVIAEKNQEIRDLKAQIEEKDQTHRAMLTAMVTPQKGKRLYIADVLLMIIAAMFAWTMLTQK